MRTIAELLRWRAQRHPSLQAVWFEGKSQSFAEFNESSSTLPARLSNSLHNSPDFLFW